MAMGTSPAGLLPITAAVAVCRAIWSSAASAFGVTAGWRSRLSTASGSRERWTIL